MIQAQNPPPVPETSPGSSLPFHASHGIYDKLMGNEIRLIRLFPEHMSTIQCEIIHTSLQDPPEYTALSYTWGDPDDTVGIRVNGSWMKVTASLHGALNALRKPDDSLLIWADAICINQNDKTEQSSQVQLMTQIYSRATSVIVWLGPESHDSNVAFRVIHALCEAADDPSLVELWITSQTYEHKFAALVSLFERSYWSRVWVVQEILNAKSVTVYCGDASVSWQRLQDLAGVLMDHGDLLKLHFRPDQKISRKGQPYAHILISGGPASFDTLKKLAGIGAQVLLEVLRICRTKHTSQPRDKVFGILGILPEDVRSYLVPDYNASLRQVYTDVVDFLLHRTRRLDVICEAIHFPLNSSAIALPSWVPDWSYVQHVAGLGCSYRFSASGETEAAFSFPDGRQRTKLKISAIRLGVVQVSGIAVGTYGGLDESLMAFLHWRAKMLDRFPSSAATGEWTVQDDAFCRTISLDQRRGHWEDWQEDAWAPGAWTEMCHHVFATLISKHLPSIRMDEKLQSCIEASGNVGGSVKDPEQRRVLQERCASRMMGRCFFITDNERMGMGTGFLEPNDIICVPLGCRTPVVLRAEGEDDEYRLVGDCYVDGCMDGEVIREWKENGGREPEPFVLR
ncbi:heterokaryon incompatibility protein-domain-containing protein [Apiospora aurea]|uniref:Heterokaryon incompatibility protein-domain-containing protein n=1 Tax=Apiospora aurea TaxID=335848 RepID=A0ABR1QZT8_9PEZI